MDSKTHRFLMKLNRQAADMFKTKKVTSEEMKSYKERAEFAYAKTGDKRVKKLLDSGAFDVKDKTVVDDKSTREIDKFYEYKIKQAIERGEIEPPKDDAFFKMMKAKLK